MTCAVYVSTNMAAVTAQSINTNINMPEERAGDSTEEEPGDQSPDRGPDSPRSPEPNLELLRSALPDLKSLSRAGELLERLQRETEALEEQVRREPDGFPPRVSSALRAAENVSEKTQETNSLFLSQHLEKARPCMESFGHAFHQVDIIERHIKYLQCLQRIEELSSSVQQCLMTNSVWEAVSAVDKMAALVVVLRESRCSHLQNFLQQTLRFWHKILKDRLTSDFEEVLATLHWPILSPPTQTLSPPPNAQDVSSQLEALVSQLLALQNSYPFSTGRKQEVCLPVQIMLLPLTKRFKFHFYGNRQTNCLSKTWSSPGLVLTRFRPDLDPVLLWFQVDFCRGLLSLVQLKVQNDASRLLYEDTLFCHLVEEVLHFEKELRSQPLLPSSVPGLLHLLLEENLLQKWLSMEKKMALEKVDSMLSSEGAWTSQYKDISDVDELKAPDCAETFMTLLQVITDRYRGLPCAASQLKFLELQRELVDDFRIRLTQVMKEESRAPLGARYCAILNAVNYISTILSDWEDNVFFLQLQQAAVSLGEESIVGSLGVTELGRLASLETSLFQGLLGLLDRLRADMTGRLLDTIMREVSDKARPYCHDRWLSLASPQDQTVMSLSTSACPMMLCVRDRLLQMHTALSLPLFQITWQGLAERLDGFIYQEVILANHFSEGGAAQLQFDMSRNLFPLFGHYCKRPENFFKHVKEACVLLTLSLGSALLLRDLIQDSDLNQDSGLQGPAGVEPSPQAALNELGVYCLSPKDVLILLNLRAARPGQ
uniref:RAD50-interacting protein 1 n=1 Tax=Periophthalmus magnuspinnatus TaxID=409849 RepID=A0A3B3ZZV7_9GOBI